MKKCSEDQVELLFKPLTLCDKQSSGFFKGLSADFLHHRMTNLGAAFFEKNLWIWRLNHSPEIQHLLMQVWAKSSSSKKYLFWHQIFNHSLYQIQLRDCEMLWFDRLHLHLVSALLEPGNKTICSWFALTFNLKIQFHHYWVCWLTGVICVKII